jgi:hypothetical protein
MCEAFDDLEEGYFISERLTGLELPSIPCLSKDARVRRTGFMSDGLLDLLSDGKGGSRSRCRFPPKECSK